MSPLPEVEVSYDLSERQLTRREPLRRWRRRSQHRSTLANSDGSTLAPITEMTSSSSLGSTSITLQFDLDRDIDSAARDVQAAINAARGYLPTTLPNNPSYRKVNPSDSPIFMLALTSTFLNRGQMYDSASTIMAQKLSQVTGVGQVTVGGSSLPGVRLELNPTALNKYGIGLEQVLALCTERRECANTPKKGNFSDGLRMWEVGANDQIFKASDYEPLVVAYRNGSAVRISDIGQAQDSVEDLRNSGYANGKPSVLVILFRQPGANIIDTVDRVRAVLPQIQASIPNSIDVKVAMDQTVTIRASVRDTEKTLILSVLLVILVVFVFLRSGRTTFIPSIAVPVSLIGTFGVMYLLGFSLDNLSLMALTISTGFVVDDAIVVIENITRYLEQGMHPFEAAMKGAQEVGSTVFTISISLIAVFIPLLLMGGIVGRLFREFAVTLSVAIAVSMVISLTATPMMCAYLLKETRAHGWMYRTSERAFEWMVDLYSRTLSVALRFRVITMLVLLATIGLNVYLFIRVPKGFFPQQDNGRIQGAILADQDTSFPAMDRTMLPMINFVVAADPAVDTVNGFTGGSTYNTARLFISLKPLEQRKISADLVIARLRPKLAKVPGATLFLQAAQDLRVGGRQSNAQYQFTMQGDNLDDLNKFAPKMVEQLQTIPLIADVSSDQQNRGLQAMIQYDRVTASRFGITPDLIDTTLYDAFGQRQVSTMYTSLNQYHVVMEASPEFWQNPLFLRQIFVNSPGGEQVPMSAFAKFTADTAPLTVTHQGLFPAVTVSFNLRPGVALGDAVNAISAAAAKTGLPPTIHTEFAGTAQVYQASLATEPILVAAALVTVYIILAMLYESYVHPITIISSLPAASVGALLALFLTHTDLSIIAIIGIILLIGIVKKNAIMMIDFALAAERNEGKNSYDLHVVEACRLRFPSDPDDDHGGAAGRLAACSWNRHRVGAATSTLGITIIGGLIMSQLLTLYTTPVVYLYFDSFQLWWNGPSSSRES